MNCRTYSKSYKQKKRLNNDPAKWEITKNTHEAIIDEATFKTVQRLRQSKKRPRIYIDEPPLFSGLVVCADCGWKLHFHKGRRQSMKEGEGYFTCSGSRSRVFDCTCHYIRNVALEQLVREDLRRVITFVQEQEDEFMRLTMETTLQEQRKDEAKMKQDLAEMRSRVAELDGFMKRIYAERNGIMPVKATMPFPAQGTRLLHSI